MAVDPDRSVPNVRPHRPDDRTASTPDADAQADGVPSDTVGADTPDHAARPAGRAPQGETGMGAFSDGEFPGGAGGRESGEAASGYGQDSKLQGGNGVGSGYAQTSSMGGYGQGAEPQGEEGESGADQHSDERYGQVDADGEQRLSPYGYGGRGTAQADGPIAPDASDTAAPDESPPDDQPTEARTPPGRDATGT